MLDANLGERCQSDVSCQFQPIYSVSGSRLSLLVISQLRALRRAALGRNQLGTRIAAPAFGPRHRCLSMPDAAQSFSGSRVRFALDARSRRRAGAR
jgi:hypothetical protein